MDKLARTFSAVDAPNQIAEMNGRRLAWRPIGSGKPIVLCTRFRGTMDVWDPAFLEALAAQGLRVITFDCSGLGLSSGERDYDPLSLARDSSDLIDALDLKDVVIAGWSLGGIPAKIVLAMHHARLTHAVLIGTPPPGPVVKPAKQLFYDTARIPDFRLYEETILFFEPMSKASREAARRSHLRLAQRSEGRCPPVSVDFAVSYLGEKPRTPPFPADKISGSDEGDGHPYPSCRRRPRHHLSHRELVRPERTAVHPSAAHLSPCGVRQHEHPEASAECIATFVRSVSRG